jgi:diadenosine tetraphosphatase ApaH/serine/threonine PP2A family protein phosphatase
VLCVLLALKLKYPEQLHLLRGSHEDIKINKSFGFGEECALRFGEDINDVGSVFQRFNRLFEYFPLAAVIQEKILCLHSGIGNSIRSVEEIDALQRPIEVVQDPTKREQQIVLDILWSDPAQEETNIELAQNKLAYGVKNAVKFTADKLKEFLKENNFGMLIRSHECVADGFERIWNGTLTTVFSATDYCGKYTNAAAVIVIRKNLEVTPKIIYPLSASIGMGNQYQTMEEEKETDISTSNIRNGPKNTMFNGTNTSTFGNSGNSNWIDNDESLKKRPATPPRLNSRGTFKKI